MKVYTLVLITFLSLSARAYYTTFDTADILPEDKQLLGAEAQYIFTRDTGFHVLGHYNRGNSENTQFNFMAGGGRYGGVAGAFFKYGPLPDIGNQPAIAVFFGPTYALREGESTLSLKVHPIVSKKLDLGVAGIWTPYISVPFGVAYGPRSTTYPIHMAGGTRWLPPGFEDFVFMVEFGGDMNAAYSYTSIGASCTF